ncbi:hypothetical protein RZS08_10890 [Arthrospira platensis SPKY1]|nr:hypothetical protein [Arthrospira platensis SPKY1]
MSYQFFNYLKFRRTNGKVNADFDEVVQAFETYAKTTNRRIEELEKQLRATVRPASAAELPPHQEEDLPIGSSRLENRLERR